MSILLSLLRVFTRCQDPWGVDYSVMFHLMQYVKAIFQIIKSFFFIFCKIQEQEEDIKRNEVLQSSASLTPQLTPGQGSMVASPVPGAQQVQLTPESEQELQRLMQQTDDAKVTRFELNRFFKFLQSTRWII